MAGVTRPARWIAAIRFTSNVRDMSARGSSSTGAPGLAPAGTPLVKDTLPGYVVEIWFGLLGPAGLPADVVAMVGEVRRGHSVFVARTFASPEDEFDYERERNHSYRLLVEIALAEDAENTPSLAALAARVGTESTGV